MKLPEQTSVAAHVAECDYSGRDKQILYDNIQITTLDSFEFTNIDFIKIDVEGYQLKVIKGAEQTILKHKPYILIEDNCKNTPAVTHLSNHFGMKVIVNYKGDYLLRKKLNE